MQRIAQQLSVGITNNLTGKSGKPHTRLHTLNRSCKRVSSAGITDCGFRSKLPPVFLS